MGACGLLPPSPQEYPILGLKLLRLLVQNRIAEFHTELELLSASAMENNCIKHAVELEQLFMEGAYNRVLSARQTVPHETYVYFMDLLAKTVRGERREVFQDRGSPYLLATGPFICGRNAIDVKGDEIAGCNEKAYDSLSINDARKILLFSSDKELFEYVKEFFLPVSNKVGGNVMTSLMKEILGTMKKKIQSFKLASGEELGEELIVELGEEFSEVIDFHNGEKFNFVQISQTRPEPLQNGADLMELESSDQQSMDAVNNESNVISGERSNSTCSQGKGTRKKLKRKQNRTGGKIDVFLEDILQTSQMRIGDAAKSLHAWYPKVISPTTGSLPRLEPLQREGDMMQLNSSDQQSMDAINITNVVGAEQSNIAVTRSQEKYTIKSHNDAANSLHVSKSTLKHVCRDYSIKKWPPSKITKFSVGSLPTGSLPRFEPLQNEGDMMQHQQSMDAINITNVVVSISTLKRACRKLGIPRWPPHHINAINKNGDVMQLDSLDQQSMDATKNGGDVICSQEKGTMKMPYREDKKTGVRIAMPSEHILQTSEESLEGAAEHHGGSPYVLQRWPTRMHSKNNEKLDSIQVFQITRPLPRPGPLQNGGDQMMQLDSLDQQSMDAINITNVVGAEQSNIAVACSQEKKAIKRLEREHKKTGVKIAIPTEDILQASEMSLNGAACRLNVSKSTLKLTLTKPLDTATKDAEIVIIKAKYDNIVIMFLLSSSSGLVELQQKVAQMLDLDPELISSGIKMKKVT
ncbi:unnamed protein product [Camellia sinensis]